MVSSPQTMSSLCYLIFPDLTTLSIDGQSFHGLVRTLILRAINHAGSISILAAGKYSTSGFSNIVVAQAQTFTYLGGGVLVGRGLSLQNENHPSQSHLLIVIALGIN